MRFSSYWTVVSIKACPPVVGIAPYSGNSTRYAPVIIVKRKHITAPSVLAQANRFRLPYFLRLMRGNIPKHKNKKARQRNKYHIKQPPIRLRENHYLVYTHALYHFCYPSITSLYNLLLYSKLSLNKKSYRFLQLIAKFF